MDEEKKVDYSYGSSAYIAMLERAERRIAGRNYVIANGRHNLVVTLPPNQHPDFIDAAKSEAKSRGYELRI